jgi:hypothetical protein
VSELTAAPDLAGWEIVERLLKDLAQLSDRIQRPAPPGAGRAADGSAWADPGAGQVWHIRKSLLLNETWYHFHARKMPSRRRHPRSAHRPAG